jgi:hypothetical protein
LDGGVKGEYTINSHVAVTGCWRDRERITCVKRVEVKKGIIMKRMVGIKCEEKARGKEKYLVGLEMDQRYPCSQRSKTISARFSCGR